MLICRNKNNLKSSLSLSNKLSVNTNTTINLDKNLRKTRSKKYLDLCEILDANGCSLPQQYIDDIVIRIKGQFNELGIPDDNMPVSLVAKCYLGGNFEVHKLDMIGRIICHFKDYEKMDSLSERARNLSQNQNYEVIEVYNDCLRAIHHDGMVSEIKI